MFRPPFILNLLILGLFSLFSLLHGKEAEQKKEEKSPEKEEKPSEKEEKPPKKEEKPPKIGNFSLPTSQQPAALFGFGGNIIDKGEVQLYLFADYFNGKKKIVSDVIPSVLFGITDDWSVFFNAPFTPIMKDGHHRSSGLEDFFIQLEYAFYNKSTKTYVDQATLVANITYPTGSVHKNPPTGFGAPSLFFRRYLLSHLGRLDCLYNVWRGIDRDRTCNKDRRSVPLSNGVCKKLSKS